MLQYAFLYLTPRPYSMSETEVNGLEPDQCPRGLDLGWPLLRGTRMDLICFAAGRPPDCLEKSQNDCGHLSPEAVGRMSVCSTQVRRPRTVLELQGELEMGMFARHG